jgi:hypothetical protein
MNLDLGRTPKLAGKEDQTSNTCYDFCSRTTKTFSDTRKQKG